MLKTTFLDLNFKNPLILASGVHGVTAASLCDMAKCGCGGVTLKSVSIEQSIGHPNPTVVACRHFVINAVGLSNPGVFEIKNEISLFKQSCQIPSL